MLPILYFELTTVFYTFQLLIIMSGVAVLFVNCCFRRSQKSTNQKVSSVGDDLTTAVLKLEENVKTDRTQEETDITQEISQIDPKDSNSIPEISPYPFEIINKGYGIHKKKRQPWEIQIGESHKKRRTRRKNSKQNLAFPTPKINNDIALVEQLLKPLPRYSA